MRKRRRQAPCRACRTRRAAFPTARSASGGRTDGHRTSGLDPCRCADRRFLRRAIALAERHSRDGRHGPFGAVVVRDGVVVGEGWNRVVAGRDPTAHAEVVALRAACRRLRTHTLTGCAIYCSCEPCPMCLAAIYWARVRRVVFACARRDAGRAGFDDERLYHEIPRPWAARSIAWRQLDRARGLRVLESWLGNPRRRDY